VMISGHGTIRDAVEATRSGAFDFLEKPLARDRVLLVVKHALERSDLQLENQRYREIVGDGPRMIGCSAGFLRAVSEATQVARSDAGVLLTGESGTGKEVMARYLHRASDRRKGPFVALNCAALPEQLLESELFGHVQGAFTGAVREKVGLFVEANGGTLFLDEVDKTTITIQGKLLQVLDNREVRPVGGNKSTKVDVRVVCATNVNLKQRIARGEFLEDLYYRLNDICFRVPPLRERPEDVPILIEHYVRRFSAEMGKEIRGVDHDLVATMAGLKWRGNVRELEKVVKRMVVLANEGGSSHASSCRRKRTTPMPRPRFGPRWPRWSGASSPPLSSGTTGTRSRPRRSCRSPTRPSSRRSSCSAWTAGSRRGKGLKFPYKTI